MKKDLLEALLDKPQREIAGSDSASRFDYQKNWAFCEMLRRHMADADYLVAFEFHDDVVFLSPSGTPSSAEFFQVKTSKSANAKKLADLTTRPKGSNSILGKMFMNFEGVLSGCSVKVILVSNVAFEFSDKNVLAKELVPKYLDKIVTRLKEEIPTFKDDQISGLHFVVTGVSIDAMRSFLHGEAMELFKTRFGEDHGLNVHSWVRLIQSEIARRNNYPSEKVSSVGDLMSNKCIGRNAVDESLTLVSAQGRTAPDWEMVRGELKDSGWKLPDLIRLSRKIPQAVSDYTDSTNIDVANLAQQLKGLFEGFDESLGLSPFIETAKSVLLGELSSPYNDPSYLAALSVVVYYEEI